MTRIDKAFSELSARMHDIAAPGRSSGSSQSIASLLGKVNAAKLRYRPGAAR